MNPAYLEDASGFRGYAEAVYVPSTISELQEILRSANESLTPLTIAGAGTGVAGGRVPQGGWVVSLERFNHLDVTEGHAKAGAGVLLRDLHAAAARTRQFYAPDPTETGASLGGTIATNASGSRSFLYGDTRRHVEALQVVLMDGQVHWFQRGTAVDFEIGFLSQPATTKHSAGFPLHPGMDWVDLFIGSEGTLGVVTEATVRLLPVPEDLLTGVVFFATDGDALQAVETWRTWAGLRMLEYMDARSLDLLRSKYPEVPHAAQACLLIEQISTDVDAWLDSLESLQALTEASWFATSAADRERFRRFRHALPEAVNDLIRSRGLTKVGSDYAVPVSRNAEMMAIYRDHLDAAFPGQYVIFGHIGDAHVHVNILPENTAQWERARSLMLDFAREAVRLGGSVGAEHGLGKRKAHLLALQYTPEQIEAMKAVKRRLDPNWLLGQGTLFPR